MIKKLLIGLMLVFSLGTATAFAATSQAQPVTSIGTYNDFGQQIRLQWKPTTGAVSYNVYEAPGYNARTGFVKQHNVVQNSYNYIQNSARQYVIQDYVSTPAMGYYTVEITAVDANGVESAPCYATVNIIR